MVSSPMVLDQQVLALLLLLYYVKNAALPLFCSRPPSEAENELRCRPEQTVISALRPRVTFWMKRLTGLQ